MSSAAAARPSASTDAGDDAPRFYDAAAVRAATPWRALIGELRDAFSGVFEAPDRHIHDLHVPGEPDATLLIMPAWIVGDVYGVKLANIVPGNGARGLPAVSALYALFSARTGRLLATMDGAEITARRTAATSALASSYLSRSDTSRMLMVGAGRLAPLLIEAHASVRPIRSVEVWARDGAKAAALAQRVATATGLDVRPTADLEAAARRADLISCATLSTEPLVRGAWLEAGAHLDLVGAFKPTMCEADPEAVARAQVFIDTIGGSKVEAGDLLRAEAAGLFVWSDVRASVDALCADRHPGRTDAGAITLFKSVGAAVEDLAAARLVHAAGAARAG